MNDLLNAENGYYVGRGENVRCSIEMFPKEQIISLSYEELDKAWTEYYTYSDTKKAHYFCNRVAKEIKRRTVNFSFFNSISKSKYTLEKISYSEAEKRLHYTARK